MVLEGEENAITLEDLRGDATYLDNYFILLGGGGGGGGGKE
jgi:hypothetical protein